MSEKLTPLDLAVAFALKTQAMHNGYAWPGTEAITDLIAAAEERERRAGIEERDALLNEARAFIALACTWREWPSGLAMVARIDAALAPRDSGKEHGGCPDGNPNCDYRRDRK